MEREENRVLVIQAGRRTLGFSSGMLRPWKLTARQHDQRLEALGALAELGELD